MTTGLQRLIDGLKQERDSERIARREAESRARTAEAKAARAMRLLALARQAAAQ